jgi:AcrR family transcriptional regulator
MAGRPGKWETRGDRRKPSRNDTRRERVLELATEMFERDGYEKTRWSDIAAALGLSSTALYHYFDTKQHCLFVIMEQTVKESHARLNRITERDAEPVEILVDALYSMFDLTEHEVLRNRLLMAEHHLLTIASPSPREEQARQSARAYMREFEFAWVTLVMRGMQHGDIPQHDPRMLTNAVLALVNSVWEQYRPHGPRSLQEIAAFYVPRVLAMMGLSPELAERHQARAANE